MNTRICILAILLAAMAACTQETEEHVVADAPESATVPAIFPRTQSAPGASVFFIMPADGATLSNPVILEFGIDGMVVVKAGDNRPNSGHHHLLIDTGLPDLGLPVPADDQHVHFGDGSTATEITLSPGQHRLQILLGDYLHIPHDPPVVSEPIIITVE